MGAPRRGKRDSPSMIGERIDGYAPIADYGAVGDGRTVALVARDGAIDWLCLPDLDSPSVFGALLDNERGGRFLLGPESVSGTERRYLPGTNVLETTFTTAVGVVRVTDAMTLPTGGLSPYRELARRVEGLAGEVPVRWRVEPRFGYTSAATRIERRAGVPIATAGRDATFTLDALLALGCAPEAQAFLYWLLHASQLTHPRLQVLYRLDGRAETEEKTLPLAGYRGSRPVRVGNGAAGQTQLDVYGEV